MKKLGFTLIELLIVIAIVGILLAVGTASYMTALKQSRDTRRKTDLEQLRQAIETYRGENGLYPATAANLAIDLEPAYISKMLYDTDDRSYSYYPSTDLKSYSLCAALEIKPTEPISDACTPISCGPDCNYEVTNP